MSGNGSQPVRRTLSRIVAWATMPIYIAGMGSVIWLNHRIGLPTDYQNLMLMIGFAVFALVGSLLVASRPENPISWIMVTLGLSIGLFPAAETYAAYVMTTRGSPDTLAVLGAWINSWYWMPLLALALIYLPLLFPDGHLPSRRWLPIAIIPGVASAGAAVLGALTDPLIGQNIAYKIDNPIGIPGMPPVEQHPLFGLLIACIIIGFLGATTAVLLRFRRARGVERQQLKWFLYAVSLIPAFILSELAPQAAGLILGLVIIALPVAIGVAVLRYRLYEIDIIIRRTLLYAALTAVLAALYYGSVLLFQQILRAITGQVGQSQVAIVISVLVIAALFNPLRHRIQLGIDRRFYRQKYNAERTLQAFAATLRDEVGLDELSGRLLDVVDETIQPESVTLWLLKNRL